MPGNAPAQPVDANTTQSLFDNGFPESDLFWLSRSNYQVVFRRSNPSERFSLCFNASRFDLSVASTIETPPTGNWLTAEQFGENRKSWPNLSFSFD